MTFKKTMLFFCLVLPATIALRVFQITKTIEYSNGLYFKEQALLGEILLGLVLAICLGLGVAGLKKFQGQVHPPRYNNAYSVSAAFVSIVLVVDFFAERPPQNMQLWQTVVVKVITIACVVYFVALALEDHLDIMVPPKYHIIPCVYVIFKIVFTFMGLSALAVISDNILLITGYVCLMLFFINYAKLYNSIDPKLAFPKAFGFAVASSLICLTQSVAYFIINIFSQTSYLHIDLSLMLSLFAFGVFTAVFAVLNFREKA